MALQSYTSAKRVDSRILKHAMRLSSGSRIASSKDDAAGLAIANTISNQVRGIDMANRNSLDAASLLQTADGALGEINNILNKIRELSVEAANGVLTDSDREKIQSEVNSLLTEIDQMSTRTEYNRIKLLDGGLSSVAFANNDSMFDVVGISGFSDDGVIDFKITKAGVPAKISSSGVSTGVSGNLFINGTGVNILATDTEAVILDKLSYAAMLNNIHLVADGADVHLITDKSGSGQSITIAMDNPDLANSLGFVAGSVSGIDAVIDNITFTDNLGALDSNYTKNITYTADGNTIVFSNGEDRLAVNVKTLLLADGGLALADGTAITDAGVLASSISLSADVYSAPFVVQIGQNKDMEMEIVIPKIKTGTLGISGLLLSTATEASAAIITVDNAIEYLLRVRGELGAYQNRLEFVSSTLGVNSVTASDSLSRIMDSDMAEEMTNYTQASVISQAAMSVLAQANQRPQQILQLLR
jgi:flagellin